MVTESAVTAPRRRGIPRSPGEHVFALANGAVLLGLALVMLYPLVHILAVSLSSPDFINAGMVSWVPRGFNIAGYELILQNPDLLRAYANTVAYAGVGTLITLTLTSMIAYSLAVPGFVLRKQLTIYLAITMFFNGGLIPTYLLIRSLGMMNTFLVMVLPMSIQAFTVFVFRAFFRTVPHELRESAFIDGATDLRICFQIVLPLSKPVLATFGLFSMVGHWNRWFEALIYLRDPRRYPLQMILRRFLIRDQLNLAFETSEAASLILQGIVHSENLKMAVIIVTMLPILCVYPFVQKYFTKGVIIGAIKG